MRLILASNSKNRQNIFKNIGWKYEVIKSTVEEHSDATDPDEYVMDLSRDKANSVASNMEATEYWNSVSNTKEFKTPFQIEEFSKYVDKEKKVLDIGCGYGRTLNELYNLGYKNLIGFDFSEGMIERGKKNFPNLDLRIKYTEKIDMPDNSVDSVILFAVLTCIVKNIEQKQLIEEIHRVLKPNGILYINDYLLNIDERNVSRYKEYKNKYNEYGVFELPEGGIFRHHSKEWIIELLKDFDTVKFKDLIFTTMNGHKTNGFYYIGRK